MIIKTPTLSIETTTDEVLENKIKELEETIFFLEKRIEDLETYMYTSD